MRRGSGFWTTVAIAAVLGGLLFWQSRIDGSYGAKTEKLLTQRLAEPQDGVRDVSCRPHLDDVDAPHTYHLRCAVEWDSGRHFVSQVTLETTKYHDPGHNDHIRTHTSWTTP